MSANGETRPTRAERHPLAVRAGPLDVPFVPRRGYADGPYGQVHFRDTGGPGAPLLLCPQAPQTSRQFDNVYERLQRRGLRAIGVDMPGFGESDPPTFVPTIEDLAVAVPPVLDALGLESAHVLGHHTGALIATEVALQFPNRVAGVVLNGPLPLSDARRAAYLEWVKGAEIELVWQADGSHFTTAFATRRDLYGEDADPATITRYIVEQFSGYAPFWIGHHAAFLYDHERALRDLEHRTLILTNTGDQIYDYALRARDLRPGFAFEALDGGGIDIVDQLPDAWSDTVAAFLHDA